MKHLPPVAISGVGCLCAAGLGLNACMNNLFNGQRHPAPPTTFTIGYSKAYPVFEVPDDFLLTAGEESRNLTRTCRLILTAVREAFDDASLTPDILQSQRVGVCIGTNVGSAMGNEAFYCNNKEDLDPYIYPKDRFLMSNPTAHIMEEFDLNGPFQTVVNACSAGTDAVGLAASWIRTGICDIAIAGGVDEMYQATYNGFISLMISDRTPCKPFDLNRNGLNLGEGAAVVILESEKMLKLRQKAALAFVRGYGSTTDAHHLIAPDPRGLSLKLAITEALEMGAVHTSDIAFVNAHGTGTLDNDRIESQVLNEILTHVPFLSTKGYTGHTLGAAGAIEAALTIAFLKSGRVPASAGFETPDPALPASPVSDITPLYGTIALSQTLAFGGNNSVLVLERGGN